MTPATTYPPLPAVGATVSFYGGTITRMDETRFICIRADGVKDRACNCGKKPLIRFIAAVNALRKAVDLAPLPMPCLYCLSKPRRGTNCFCSKQCEAQHYGMVVPQARALKPKSEKHYTPQSSANAETPLPPREYIAAVLKQVAIEHPLKGGRIQEETKRLYAALGQPSLHDARVAADALIARRLAVERSEGEQSLSAWPKERTP